MRQSQLFTKTRREAPKDEEAKNAKLLIRGGFINKEMAGVYSLLPLGLRVVNKIKRIVSEEMDRLGSQEILMSTLQDKEVWRKTDRWDDKKVDVWFKSNLKSGAEVGFGWSHEEPIAEMMKSHVASYHDLPAYVHQFQNKLRNEVRAKSGILRCREFIMKDMYCFTSTEEENDSFYNKVIKAYKKVFERVGLGQITYITSASGGVFTDKFSHEFQTICDAGEDIIYINRAKQEAINEEIYNNEEGYEQVTAAEVGNIFNFGTKKSEQLELYFKDKDGQRKPAYLSSYGIGITRLMGVVAEVLSDEDGIVWPREIAPFEIHLLRLGESETLGKKADAVYEELCKKTEVLYDDRNLRAGEKFADADLIGIPVQIIVGEKSLENEEIEVKNRKTGETKKVKIDEIGALV